MPWERKGRTIQSVGVVGSGQIGPDIALHFARSLAPHGVRVTVTDLSQAALDAGAARARRKVEKAVESGSMKPDAAKATLDALRFTTDAAAFTDAGLIVEAATEDLSVKRRIFADLARRCPADAILASNSSHMEPDVLFEGLDRPGRALVVHYFFPAERNPLVEVVPGARTDPAVSDACMDLYEAMGKVPIRVRSRYGYAIDPIFEGLFLAALLLADSGVATPQQIDAVARKALRLGVGPFTAMNLAGGTPITRIGLAGYRKAIMPWFRVPESLATRETPWPTAARGEEVPVDAKTFETGSRALRGAYFGLVTEILEAGVSNVDDLDMAVEIGLAAAPPFRLMNEVGHEEAKRLVAEYAERNPGFRVPAVLSRTTPWKVRRIVRRDRDGVAILTIRRPQAAHALDRALFAEIGETFRALRADASVRAVVLTGFGTKAFVSGADVSMLAAVRTAEEGEALSWSSQEALLAVQDLGKPVVCALNGPAMGGGSELAMACTTRVARAGLPVCFAQPEPRLGIIPGAGATQRLPRLVGIEAASEILRTGRTVSGAEALRLGWLEREVPPSEDLADAAAALARERASSPPRPFDRGALRAPAALPSVDIGPLSRRVDEIQRKAILEGCSKPLLEGLRFESRCFGEVCATQDMRIGLQNFLDTQGKRPAPFVHG